MVIYHQESVNCLQRALDVFRDNKVEIRDIDARRPRDKNSGKEYFVKCNNREHTLRDSVIALRQRGFSVKLLPPDPWMPMKISDLDICANNILKSGSELTEKHPGFADEAYRKRREQIVGIALNYKHGAPIPRVDYTKEEISIWHDVFCKVTNMYPTHACQEFNQKFRLLQDNGIFTETNIPQLEDVSAFLYDRTGFRLRPVAGLIKIRAFLAGLAFRVLFTTQYVRHATAIAYTEEPDVCHELLGHVPLLLNTTFAQFSQDLGLASLGAPDEYITKLARLHWFTIEFGLCRQNNELRAYGASLLTSPGELQHSMEDATEKRALETSTLVEQKIKFEGHQNMYFVADSLESAIRKIRYFYVTSPRSFAVEYNPYNMSVSRLEWKEYLHNLSIDAKSLIAQLEDAINAQM